MAHEIQDKELSEEEYDENADEDFIPDQNDGHGNASPSEDGDGQETTAAPKPSKGGRKRKVDAGEDNELDSGDEVTIQERRKKKRKKATGTTADGEEDEDSGGEGGLIKTRAQRFAEKVEKKNRKRGVQGSVTVDVDALWESLKDVRVGREAYLPPAKATDADTVEEGEKENSDARARQNGDELITIKRRIEYAGEVTEVEERVPRSSEEGQRYLREHPEEADSSSQQQEGDGRSKPVNRPLRRPSLFEPNPAAVIKGVPAAKLRPRAPNRLDVLMAQKREEDKRKAEKMSTVQKSALDWKGWVDRQEGLREELDVFAKGKGGYLEREDFLGRAEYARETQAREARLRG